MRVSWIVLAAVAGLLAAAVAIGRQPAHALASAAPSFVLLAINLFVIGRFAAGPAGSPVLGMDRQVAKWGYLLIAIVAYAWLVLTVANDWLPQKSAAAALTVGSSMGGSSAMPRVRLFLPALPVLLWAQAGQGRLLARALAKRVRRWNMKIS